MFVASAGGHLAQLLPLESWWKDMDRSWVTFRRPEVEAALTNEDVTWCYFPTTRNIPNAIRNFFLAWPTLRAKRPDVLVSTGAGVSVPFFIVARLLHIHTVYIECFDRITMPTLSGRLCYPMSDVFCVQWEEQLSYYPEAINIGPIL
ncbi:PssD/Cps14F family polysaccharide biosynthesis glycosyltransferase [Arthrobacter sp. HY1533]|uniref:PssD/Cps14F family polysaccharide biosynthesis glycosyltransferase n=1 Tax=Arthrobacter sp. HY1533 TaxID=2970919 RepID=UPI0022B9E478|nr:PssD/Cps14F family polysaccharide biosynthesis glycosyltransferase [Arthrobacter sp. HY1533]